MSNLNEAVVPLDVPDNRFSPIAMQDHSTIGSDGKTQVFFKNIEGHLIRFINESEVILGCVAWLTSQPILEALSKKKGVSIIVQKEDFLRPDFMSTGNWEQKLGRLYEDLPRSLDWRDFPSPLDELEIATEPILEPIRCVGNYNVNKQPAYPRSHHKFVLFCRAEKKCNCKSCQNKFIRSLVKDIVEFGWCDCDSCVNYEENRLHIQPYAVWTGSFNFTRNAVMSFENALVLYDPKIVEAFYREYLQIAALSEPLNWTKSWVNPEWRVQTFT
jgi:hypothetical protein